jgi:hypothetical protein
VFTIYNTTTKIELSPIGSKCIKNFMGEALHQEAKAFAKQQIKEEKERQLAIAKAREELERQQMQAEEMAQQKERELAREIAFKMYCEKLEKERVVREQKAEAERLAREQKAENERQRQVELRAEQTKRYYVEQGQRTLSFGQHIGKSFDKMSKNTKYINYLRENALRQEFKDLVAYFDYLNKKVPECKPAPACMI